MRALARSLLLMTMLVKNAGFKKGARMAVVAIDDDAEGKARKRSAERKGGPLPFGAW